MLLEVARERGKGSSVRAADVAASRLGSAAQAPRGLVAAPLSPDIGALPGGIALSLGHRSGFADLPEMLERLDPALLDLLAVNLLA